MRQAQKERKNLDPNSVHTRPGQENYEKNRKKIKKLKNLFPALFLAKTGLHWWRKREKNFTPEFCSYPTRARKFEIKKSKKIQKIKKNSFRHYFQPKWDEIGGEREKKILVTTSVHTRLGHENSKKITKKLKNPFPALFFAKMG